jgi:sulfhydrogenase subunit beta (sulfur reductase)
MPERIVIGVKNCDLSSLQIHDYVFLKNEPIDPYYKEAREKTLLVTADCAAPCEVCFCTAVGEQPYPKQDFDINLSPLASGCLVETGSPRGEQAIEPLKNLLEPADETLIKQRDEQRQKVTKQVSDQAAGKGLRAGLDYQAAVKKSFDSKFWNSFAADCVECGACNFSCCTCHCFLLADGMAEGKTAARISQWDSCLYMNFARVAGGANPRQHRAERLYNRFDKKFVFFPTVLKTYACDGCGRCIEACTGKIDIREVLKKALDETESI